MSRFFINRPVFAWVLAGIIVLIGIVSITRLPVSMYPDIAPVSVSIDAVYPGASATAVENSVTQIIEQNMTGLDRLVYIASTSDHTGHVSITLTFASGTNPDIAQIQVQNKLQQAVPLLPQVVQQQGISVSRADSGFMMMVAFVSDDGRMSASDVGDYVATNIVEPTSRLPGVGSVQMFGSKYAMRIWLDADKLNAYGLTPADITAAVQAQNGQTSIGELGDLPAAPGQQINATITAQSRLKTAEQFRRIVLNSNSGGASLHLSDVARVELGQASYSTQVAYNGKPASGVGIIMSPGANALETVRGVEDMLTKLKPRLPTGLRAVVPYDTTPYVKKSIAEVIKTLFVAILLVFLVMFLFLQNLRATLIPTIAVPVVLLGTFTILALAGYSINMLTMFAIVLAIGLLVDDAIIVVENVERLMNEEGLSPIEATHRSMRNMTGALIGISAVLSAVYIPMAFLNGSVGVIYRQFSITIVSAMVLSVIVAIVLTPALCATVLKPINTDGHRAPVILFSWFNRSFDRAGNRYQRIVAHMLGRPLRYLVVYIAISAIMGFLFVRMPTAFLPDEDQNFLFTLVKGPVGATQSRTTKVLDDISQYFLTHEKNSVESIFTIAGFSFGGSGQNSGFGYVQLKDWGQRVSPETSVGAIQGRASRVLSSIKDAKVFALAPPPILNLGTSSGFDFFLQDDFGQGHVALVAARNQLVEMASNDPIFDDLHPVGPDDAPQLSLDIDPAKASAFGLSMNDVNDTLAIAWGGRYIDDFIDRGRVKRVIVQADAPYRMVPEDLGRWHVRNNHNEMVSVASFTNSRWENESPRLERYNGSPAMEFNGEAAPGVSSGDAMKEVEKLAAKLPPGFSISFTGQSYEERSAGAQTPILYALSLVVVFMSLAALYESWSIPTAILLAVPLGIIGAALATILRGLECDIYFQVAMLTTIGLTAKNAILIVEFAKKNLEAGNALIEATLRAARSRLRPIIMTSLAFGFGVLPLAVAVGPGAGAQRVIGTGVFGGTLAGTFLGILFIPLLFLVVQRASDFMRRAVSDAMLCTPKTNRPRNG